MEYKDDIQEWFEKRQEKLSKFKIGKTSLSEVWKDIDVGCFITLNVVNFKDVIMSNTIDFAREIVSDKERDDLMVLENVKGHMTFISKLSMVRYTLTHMDEQGIHFVFTYQI